MFLYLCNVIISTGNLNLLFNTVSNVSEISLTIYDINGRVIDVLAQGVYTPGVHSFIWDGMTLSGEIVPSGVYLYKLITPNQTFSKHLTIIR